MQNDYQEFEATDRRVGNCRSEVGYLCAGHAAQMTKAERRRRRAVRAAYNRAERRHGRALCAW
jgi:hypothetical protein